MSQWKNQIIFSILCLCNEKVRHVVMQVRMSVCVCVCVCEEGGLPPPTPNSVAQIIVIDTTLIDLDLQNLAGPLQQEVKDLWHIWAINLSHLLSASSFWPLLVPQSASSLWPLLVPQFTSSFWPLLVPQLWEASGWLRDVTWQSHFLCASSLGLDLPSSSSFGLDTVWGQMRPNETDSVWGQIYLRPNEAQWGRYCLRPNEAQWGKYYLKPIEACEERPNLGQMKRPIEAHQKRPIEIHTHTRRAQLRHVNRHAKIPNLGQMKRPLLACLNGPLHFSLFSWLNYESPLIDREMSHDRVTSCVPLHFVWILFEAKWGPMR